MAEEPASPTTLRLRLISDAAPPTEHENRPTEFGLKDKKRQLHRGQELLDGTVVFDVEIQVKLSEALGTLRFQGPFVLGKPGEQYVGLIWNYSDDSTTIRGQKIRLDTLTSRMIYQVTGSKAGILQASVLPITQKCATVPVEWSVVSDSIP
jgi:hypothetical protein